MTQLLQTLIGQEMIYKAGRTPLVRDMGGFVTHINLPGWLMPKIRDHGHGPLAMVVESLLVPGRLIAMHEHRDDEIISWVPDGVMRHDDRAGGKLVTDKDHLMVMNAGRSFWHSEETCATDPPLRMLQIIIRPHAAGLEPAIQHGPMAPAVPDTWRHLAGPEGSGAPFHVRNNIDLYDIWLEEGARVTAPASPGRDTYFYVFNGSVEAGGHRFGEGAQGLMTGSDVLLLSATADSSLVAFLIDPSAPCARSGTVGDHPGIPPPWAAKVAMLALKAKRWWRRAERR